MKNIILVALLSVLFFSCDSFEYHPYDGHIKGEKDINKKNIARIEEACKGRDFIRFAMISDTHRYYDDTKAFTNVINKRTDIDFVIHGGDIADLGATKEFVWMRDIMNRLSVPYVALIGNHDCLANGEEMFNSIFGETDFSFTAGNVKFMCLNTNALMYDYSRAIPDFGFIEDEYKNSAAGHEKTVFVMHAAPYSDQFNNNAARVFQKVITEFPGLQFCLNGHEHEITVDDHFGDGILYYGCASAAKRIYLEFTITKDSYTYDVVHF